MATTFTGVFLAGAEHLLIAHSGDSRAYRVRDGRFERQTRDDSYVQVLVDRGIIAPEDAATPLGASDRDSRGGVTVASTDTTLASTVCPSANISSGSTPPA